VVAHAELVELPGEPGRPPGRFWDLTLECTHVVRRPVRYRPAPIGPHGRRRRLTTRAAADILPAQDHAYCDQCPTAPAHEITRIRVRASPARAAAFVELLRRLDPTLDVDPPEWRAAGFVDIYCRSSADLEGAPTP